jgi:hypothetical protein
MSALERLGMDPDWLEREALELPQVDCREQHHFGPGVYIREITIPAGTCVIGHAHRGEHLCVLQKGTLAVVDGSGEVRRITAPMIFTAPPGRKVGYAPEDDVVFWNVFPNPDDGRDLDAIEARLVDKSAAWVEHHRLKALEEAAA